MKYNRELLHSQITNRKIRLQNLSFNKKWISSRGLVYFKASEVIDIPEHMKTEVYPSETVWLQNINRAMTLLPKSFNHEEYNLVDLGSGSGIALLYFFENFKFLSYRGIDISKKMIKKSIKNLQLYNNSNKKNISYDNLDISNFFMDDKPTFFYMFSPFGKKTLKKFLDINIDRINKTESVLIYINDIHISTIYDYSSNIIRDLKYNISFIDFKI